MSDIQPTGATARVVKPGRGKARSRVTVPCNNEGRDAGDSEQVVSSGLAPSYVVAASSAVAIGKEVTNNGNIEAPPSVVNPRENSLTGPILQKKSNEVTMVNGSSRKGKSSGGPYNQNKSQGSSHGRRKDGHRGDGKRSWYKPHFRSGNSQPNQPVVPKYGYNNPICHRPPICYEHLPAGSRNGAKKPAAEETESTSTYIFDPFFDAKDEIETEIFEFEPAKTKIHLSDANFRMKVEKRFSEGNIASYSSDDKILESIDCRRLHGSTSVCQFCDGKTGRWRRFPRNARHVGWNRLNFFECYQNFVVDSFKMKIYPWEKKAVDDKQKDEKTDEAIEELEHSFPEKFDLN